VSKLVFEHVITSSLGSIRYCSVNTETEPNTLSTEFFFKNRSVRISQKSIFHRFRTTNRTKRFSIYRMPDRQTDPPHPTPRHKSHNYRYCIFFFLRPPILHLLLKAACPYSIISGTGRSDDAPCCGSEWRARPHPRAHGRGRRLPPSTTPPRARHVPPRAVAVCLHSTAKRRAHTAALYGDRAPCTVLYPHQSNPHVAAPLQRKSI
jgi:hypothetical protein